MSGFGRRVTSTFRRDPRPSIIPDAASFDSSIPAPISTAPRAPCGNVPLDTQREFLSGNVQCHQDSASQVVHPLPASPALDRAAFDKIIDDFAEKFAARLRLLVGDPLASVNRGEMPAPHPAAASIPTHGLSYHSQSSWAPYRREAEDTRSMSTVPQRAINVGHHRMGPDTLMQDNHLRLARIRTQQTTRTPLVPQWNEHDYLYQSRPISGDPPMLLLVNPSSPFHSIPVAYVEYAREYPSAGPTNTAGWLRTTFKNSEEAEEALLVDRPRFLQQHDILCLLPQDIRKYISYNGDNGQINGFEKLFVYLECSSAAGELRERIVAYFYSSPHLRGHLKTDRDDLV